MSFFQTTYNECGGPTVTITTDGTPVLTIEATEGRWRTRTDKEQSQ